MAIFHSIEGLFEIFVQYSILFLEMAGVLILIITAVKSFYGWFTKKGHIQLNLAKGIALALEFKLGGEVLRTVIVREKSELIILGAIILLRGALTFLIHWEIKGEESRMKDKEDLKKAIEE